MFRATTLALALTLSGLGTAPAVAVEPDIPAALVTADEAMRVLVRKSIGAEAKSDDEGAKADRKVLEDYYQNVANPLLWLPDGKPGAKAQALVGELRKADDWGLSAAAFDVPDLDRIAGAPAEAVAAAEIGLSLAALKYARHARGGRFDPTELSRNLDVTPQIKDPKLVLADLAASGAPDAVLRGMHPKHPQFEKLRQTYLKMTGRSGEAATSAKPDPIIIPEGRLIRPGDRDPRVALIRKRLGLAAGEQPEIYDNAVVDAVRTFQRENGLSGDGVVGTRVRTALNGAADDGSAKGSASTLLSNMERWRYVPENLGRTHVWVNVPEFQVRVVSEGKVIHSERVIAGKPDTQTVIFSANMQRVIFHPYWNVPDSIKVKELHPHLIRGSAVLQRQGLRVKYGGRDIDPGQVDWGSADMSKFHVFQPPGGGNVLGIVKFEFPNKHAIYMHDTPTKHLFNNQVRAFSHGCVRVRNPRRLAEVLLDSDKGWSTQKVAQMLDGPPDNQIGLSTKIPVHIVYFTAWVGDDGKTEFRKDLYGHDERIRQAMAGRPIRLIAQNDPARIAEQSVKKAREENRERMRRQAYEVRYRSQPQNIFSWIFN